MISLRSSRALLLFVTLLALFACSDDTTTAKKRKKTPHLVETAQANIKPISITKTLPGTLETIRSIKIFNQEEGLLIRLPYYEGDPVKKGDLLARLDDALVEADLNKARASLKQAELDLKRLKDLVPRRLASEDEIAKAKTAVDIAQSELDQNQARFIRTKILAPIDGIISERHAEPGDVVPVHSHLLTLIDTSGLKAKVHVSELLLPLINQGDTVDITIDALNQAADTPEEKARFKGRITRVHPTIDPATRKGVIEIELDPVPEDALPGQLCRITLKTQNRNRLMVPFDSVRHDNRGAYVFQVKDGKAIQVFVNTGLENESEVEIIEGLKESDSVVIKGFFGLKHKAEVSVKDLSRK